MKTLGKPLTAIVVPLLIIALVANLAACGTILHPERQGQRAGRIDPGIAVLDGVGLLFFVIPGVIAFAVDFSNHTIYLPHGRSSANDTTHKYTEIQVNKKLDMTAIENAIRDETGAAIDLRQSNVEVVRLDSAADLDSQFALYDADKRIALAP